jgi:outer membrane protein OmpA-like peptidoglycan-associated protein
MAKTRSGAGLIPACISAAVLLFVLPGPAPGQEDDIAIPSGAHEKAVLALKALGPDRGGRAILSRSVAILGLSKEVRVSRVEIQKALSDLGAKETKTEVQIELASDVLFDFDRADVRPESEETLRKVGQVIKAYRSPNVVIVGHTDSKGGEDYNLKLSIRRADSVKDWLAKKAGVEAGIIKTDGAGESKPVVPNTNPDGSDNPEGRRKNRRVEITVRKS